MITLSLLLWYARVVSLINVFCCYGLFMENSCVITVSSLLPKRKNTLVTVICIVVCLRSMTNLACIRLKRWNASNNEREKREQENMRE